MKVSKRIERVCLGLVIAALVAYFCYQVAYSTNESSYKFGYNTISNTASCTATQIRTNNGDDCGRATISAAWVCGFPNNPDIDHAFGSNDHVTNQTACYDGVVNGFVHWCGIDHKDCEIIMRNATVQLNSTRTTN